MKHEFTNNDLGRALDQVTYDAGKIQGVPYVTLRQFLDALPDVPHCGDCAVDRAKAGVYEQLLDHPYFDGWSEADASVEDYMIGRLNEAHAAEQDEWQECTADELRPYDQYKVIGANWEFIDKIGGYIPAPSTIMFYGASSGSPYTWSDLVNWEGSLYRIPAPVQHPDPVKHPVIIIRGGDIYDGIPMPQDAMWIGTSYESRTHSFQPGDITDFTPAKVVADDDD